LSPLGFALLGGLALAGVAVFARAGAAPALASAPAHAPGPARAPGPQAEPLRTQARPLDEGGGKKHDPQHPCITYWGEAQFGAYAYNHIVYVDNGCDEDARCQVWTNVNEKKQTVDVPSGETKDVVTFIGSPAREFTPYARCELQ
jgi:hypothetical protein